jgi:hypothetical protein
MGTAATSIYLPLVRTPMILPTAAYDKAPAMDPGHVARIICRAMYTKRRRYMPWWIIFGQLGSVLFRGVIELLMPSMLRKRGK